MPTLTLLTLAVGVVYPRAAAPSAKATQVVAAVGVEGPRPQATVAVGMPINVKEFGAAGDGHTDDSAAISAALHAAVSSSSVQGSRVHFPAGKYAIMASGILSAIGASAKGPISITGDGWGATELILMTTNEERWFYDNGTTPRLQLVTWSDIKFSGSGSHANGFRMWSAGHEQGFRFTNCWFYNLVNAFELNGTGNDSEMYFFGCRFDGISGTVYTINNQQSVSHGFYGCDFIPIHGNIFKVGPSGGGDVSIFGGSAVMRPAKGDVAAVHYLITIPDAAHVGPQNGQFSFFGFRLESHAGSQSRLVNLASTNGSVRVAFHGCDLATSTGGVREAVTVNLRKTVLFDGGTAISPEFAYRVVTPASVRDVYQNQGEILFHDALIPDNLYDLVTLESGAGHVAASGCTALRSPSGIRRAIDFDLGWESTGLGQTFRAKNVLLLSSTQPFPFDGRHESMIVLPPNSVIHAVYAYKPACASTSDAYQLVIGNDNKSQVYYKSASVPEKNEVKISKPDLLINAGKETNSRTVRLWAVGGHSACIGGYAIVEYF